MARTIALPDIDDYLGPAESRFFGSGYRKAEYFLSPLASDTATLRCVAGISYPADWSKKKAGVDLRPHLSTVDTMILGVDLTEALLAVCLGLGPEQRSAAQVHKIVIQAGTSPEEDLGSVPIEARVIRTKPVDAGLAETTTAVQVGQMRARCVVRHPAVAGPGPVPVGRFVLANVLGPAERRFWGGGFRHGRQGIHSVVADIDSLNVQGTLRVAALPAEVCDGLGGRPVGPTMVDAFVSILQMVQVLLYEMDGVPRSESNTLWMQQTTLELSADHRPDQSADATIIDSRLIDMPDGQWRNVEFVGSVGTIRQRSLFAHRLPALSATTS